jgi:hypothetical protein
MPMPQCQMDDGQPATFLGTVVSDGSTVQVCDEHLLMFCLATVQQMTGLDPAPFIQAISDDVAGTAEGAPTDEPPSAGPSDVDDPHPTRTRKGGRGPKTSPVAGTANGQPAERVEIDPASSRART